MVHFLYGPDTYRLRREVARRRADFSKKNPRCLVERFEGAEPETIERLGSFVKNQSIFAPVKFAIFEAAEVPAEFAPIGALAAAGASMTLVVISEKKPAAAAQKGIPVKSRRAEEFGPLKGKEWRDFVKEEAERAGVSFAPKALALLADAYEGESWRLVTELEKLAALGKRPVEEADVLAQGVGLPLEFWPVLQGLRGRTPAERLAALQRLFWENEPAAKAFFILSGFSRDKALDFASYDLWIKSGRLDYEEVLLDFALGSTAR